jgi:hypothetical protein
MLSLHSLTHSCDAATTQLIAVAAITQGVYDIVSARYPTPEAEAVTLAALQLQADVGENATISPLTDAIETFVPEKHLRSMTGQVVDTRPVIPTEGEKEKKIVIPPLNLSTTDKTTVASRIMTERDAQFSTLTKQQAKRAYLDRLLKLPHYV